MKFNTLNNKGTLAAGTWQIVSEQTLSEAATSVTISNLDGDTDGEYRVIVRSKAGANNQVLSIIFNSDTGNNYGHQYILGDNTSAVAAMATGISYALLGYCYTTNSLSMFNTIIKAKSGVVRTLLTSGLNGVSGTTVVQTDKIGSVWSNTADNITSMSLLTSNVNSLGVGTYILVMKKVESTTTAGAYNSVSVPMGKLTADTFETIYENTLGADATSVTISGLDGDTDVVYELETRFIGSLNNVASYYVALNNDTSTSNYGRQTLYGSSTTIAAVRWAGSTNSGYQIGDNGASNNIAAYRAVIYVKSGYIRTLVGGRASSIASTTVTYCMIDGQVWNNTANNITSLVFSSDGGNNFKTGSYIRLKTLKRKV